MIDKKKQGKILKLMREIAGYTQAEVAKACGWQYPQQVSVYETGWRRMGPKTQAKFASALGVPVEEFERMLQSEGRPEVVRTWVKLHEIHNHNDADELLRAFQRIIQIYQNAQVEPDQHEVYDHLMRQIRLLSEKYISKKD